MAEQKKLETLGPAERIIQALISYTDHLYHGRPGVVTPGAAATVGVTWTPAIWKLENDKKMVYTLDKGSGKVLLGELQEDKSVTQNGRVVATFRDPGLFPEVAAWMYRQVAEVWKLDNEFAAKWASWAYSKDHRDLKVVLAAFMLLQSRCGDPVLDDGKVAFFDDDYRDIGEAMCLLPGPNFLDAKTLLRVGDMLRLPQIAEINRELGFGKSARNAPMGRYETVVRKWLQFRERNPQMLEGLVKKGFRTTVIRLAQMIGYKPLSEKFFEILRWKQKQAKDGRRSMAIGKEVSKADLWTDLSEAEICQRIVDTKLDWKQIVGKLPKGIGVTEAIMSAAIEAGSLSNADMIILTPTLEDLGLLKDDDVSAKWEKAVKSAENQRAANIAKRVKKQETVDALEEAAESSLQKKIEEATRGLRIYFVVDKSGSMQDCLERAKSYLTRMMPGFPPDRVHVSVFNTFGQELTIKTIKRTDANGVERDVATAATIEHAFRGHMAGGGTLYSEGVRVLAHHKPAPDEDLLVMFVGDEEDYDVQRLVQVFADNQISPVAFGLLKVGGLYGRIIQDAAAQMGIPCLMLDEALFEGDTSYGVARILRNLMASTPVTKPGASRLTPPKRVSLIEEISNTKLLEKPVWA